MRGGGTTTKQSDTDCFVPRNDACGERNDERVNNSNSQRLLLLFFIFNFQFSITIAQQVFNKVYMLKASASMYCSIAPLGNNGSFMAVAQVADSSSKRQEIKIVRCNPKGEVQAENIIRHSGYPYYRISAQFKSLDRVHDNLYALVATRWVGGDQSGSCLITIDSNGVLQQIKDVLEHAPTAPDTFSYLAKVLYDGVGGLIVGGSFGSSYIDSSKNFLMKFDSNLVLIWKKEYRVKGILNDRLTGDLVLKDDRYLLFGGAQQNYSSWYDTTYKTQSLIIATDTAGNLQWHYASPVKWMFNCEATIISGITTKDGGYLYLTTGNVYDFYATAPATDPWGKQKLIKLDATRNKIWEKELETFNHPFGTRPDRMMELEDSSIVIIHQYSTDSLSYAYNYRKFLFSRYLADGSLMYERKLTPPKDIGDTSQIFTSWAAVDFCRMPDKGFLLAGVYKNGTIGTVGYNTEKGWLIRLDSNGCLGIGDSQWMKSSVVELPQVFGAGFKVYPNPTSNTIHLTIAANELKVYNTYGQVVIQTNYISAQQPISVSQLSNGLYFVAAFDKEKNKVGVAKFYKE